jgi:molybdate transport system substrate-binding protein
MRAFLSLFALLAAACAHADDAGLNVAAAANLSGCIENIDAAFSAENGGAAVKLSTGSSGNFYAQIKNGAPFDVFLSADMDFPRKLIADGAAQADSLRLYASGRLALWTVNAAVDPAQGLATVNAAAVKKLAIANPDTAPYGRAAKAALQKAGLWDAVQGKLVTGENIAQTAQFVQTGNADLGFVAYSNLRSPALNGLGRFWIVPDEAFPPIEQGAVIAQHGRDNPLSARYLAFLAAPRARTMLAACGYHLPPATKP